MIAGGGLGDVDADEVGPIDVQAPNGVVDVVVADEAEAVAVTKKLLGYFQGATDAGRGARPDRRCATWCPSASGAPTRSRRSSRRSPTRARSPSCASASRPRWSTAFARIEGRPVGVIANNTMYMAGAVTSGAADKAARFLQLCDAFGLPIVSLVDTPGYMVGPKAEADGLVRRASRLLVAGARAARAVRRGDPAPRLRPRRAGDGGRQPARAAADGRLAGRPPRADGAGGRGAPGLRKELEAIEDDDEREQRVREVTAAAQENAKAINAAQLFEIDDVIDPAETRALIASTLAAASLPERPTHGHRFVDTW